MGGWRIGLVMLGCLLAGPAAQGQAVQGQAVQGQAAPAAPAKPAARPSADSLRNNSGLAVPRFQSLRAERAYLRAGPGREYPVVWVFVRPGVPLEVVREWNLWRKVRDADGAEGWMDRAMLGTARTFQFTRQLRQLHARPDLSSPVVWRAEPGAVARITMCDGRWCRVEAEGRAGYVLRDHGFGTFPDELIG